MALFLGMHHTCAGEKKNSSHKWDYEINFHIPSNIGFLLLHWQPLFFTKWQISVLIKSYLGYSLNIWTDSHHQSLTKLWEANWWTLIPPTGSRFKWTLSGGGTISNLFWMLSSSFQIWEPHKLIFTWFVKKKKQPTSIHSEAQSFIDPMFSSQCSKMIPMQILKPALTHSFNSPGLITFSEKVASFFLRSIIPQLLHRVIFTLQKSSAMLLDCNSVSFSLSQSSNQRHNPFLVQWVNLPEACSS